jgi:hypothetical protein
MSLVKPSQGPVKAGVQTVEYDARTGQSLSAEMDGQAAEQSIHVSQAMGHDLNGRV